MCTDGYLDMGTKQAQFSALLDYYPTAHALMMMAKLPAHGADGDE